MPFRLTPFSRKLSSAILLALLPIGAVVLVVRSLRDTRESAASAGSNRAGSRFSQELADKVALLAAKERSADQTVWAGEMLAQDCGRTFESLWDSLNAASNKLDLIASFRAGEIVLGKWNPPQTLPHGIALLEPAGPGPALSADDWRRFVGEFQRAGWELVQTEFRHNRFQTNETGQPRQSHFYFSAHLTNSARPDRAMVEGDMIVDWAARRPGEDLTPVKRIDARHLRIKTRHGEPPFQPILTAQIAPSDRSSYIDPLILYDLDGDGLSEIILAAKNLVYHRREGDRFESEPLCSHPTGPIFAAVVADFDGDGFADFLCAKLEGLVLFKGSPRGTFDEPGRPVWTASPRLKNPMVLTCGDIDHDGDLDVFVGQYKVPTLGQILRPDFYDANDGHPAYLLLNDGHGNFSDATAPAGLEKKQGRRVYSASLVDLNDDGNLDLLVVSDFAGVDLYANDGRGHFTDVTRDWVAEPHAFGMAHALGDFNGDGRLDFLMIGMNSPSVDRLEHLGLTRPRATDDPTMRSRMTYGNRLYLARAGGGFEQTSLSDSIARSGWSWGCSAFDFDNDGFPDVYIANGMESKQTVRDYEPEFWLHDLYVDDSVDDLSATAYLTAKFSRTRGAGWSYGGYEKNRLYLNRRGMAFVEIGHLMGVALEQDSRNVVADDLDGDGRMDLLVTTFEVWPEPKQTLRVYKNTLTDCGNWIGFRFREGTTSPAGVRVALRYNGRSAVRQNVTGDSFRSQHANTLHFGLGDAERVESVEIRWPGGQALTLHEPALNRYHSIGAPAAVRKTKIGAE